VELCLTLSNISLPAYQASEGAYNAALQTALAQSMGSNLSAAVAPESIQVTRVGASPMLGWGSTNGSVLYLRLLSPSGGVASRQAAFSSLFNSSIANTPSHPALPTFLALLVALGLPPGNVYASCPSTPPPPVGLFAYSTLSQSIAFNIPYAAWRGSAYSAAVQSAVADVLGAHTVDVQVQQLLPGSRGGTILRLSIATASTSSETGSSTSTGGAVSSSVLAPRELIAFLNLFSASGDGFNTATGDAAIPLLVQKLVAYGLPVTRAYYGAQPVTGPIPA